MKKQFIQALDEKISEKMNDSKDLKKIKIDAEVKVKDLTLESEEFKKIKEQAKNQLLHVLWNL